MILQIPSRWMSGGVVTQRGTEVVPVVRMDGTATRHTPHLKKHTLTTHRGSGRKLCSAHPVVKVLLRRSSVFWGHRNFLRTYFSSIHLFRLFFFVQPNCSSRNFSFDADFICNVSISRSLFNSQGHRAASRSSCSTLSFH